MGHLQPSACLHQRILETEFYKTWQCPNRSMLKQFVADNEKLSLSVKRNEHAWIAWMNCYAMDTWTFLSIFLRPLAFQQVH